MDNDINNVGKCEMVKWNEMNTGRNWGNCIVGCYGE